MGKYINELIVRTVGPALVFVLELEAPFRFETLASTDSEFQRLKHWTIDDPSAAEVCRVAFAHKDLGADADRASSHARRLAGASPLGLGERVA